MNSSAYVAWCGIRSVSLQNWCGGTFIMLHKKGSRDDMANYRAICLLCHSYKLLSVVVARRLMAVLDDRLPDTKAGFRPARGCRDNVCALGWFIDMVLREGRQAVVTFIDYSAAFDTESQLFLDSALVETGVSSKVRRIVQAIFAAAAATGVVRIKPGVHTNDFAPIHGRRALYSHSACGKQYIDLWFDALSSAGAVWI